MAKLALPPEAVAQLKALIEAYGRRKADLAAAAPTVKGTDDEIGLIKERVADPKATLWWTDLISAELCYIEILDEASLRARVGGWRRRMQETVGDARYALYSAIAPDPKTAPVADVRADLAECIRAVYYFYSSYGVAARSRRDVTKQTFLVALAILGIQAVIAVLLAIHPTWSWWPALSEPTIIGLELLVGTSAAAVLGSMVSVQARLQDPKVEVDPFYRYVQTHADRLSIAVVSPIFAGVFGLVIYALIASGLSGGKAFPRFDKLIAPNPPLADVTLLLLYGFLAGFAERLVPDALTRIAARALSSLAGPAQPMQPGAPQSGPKISVVPPSISLKAGENQPFTASFPGGKDDITARSENSAIVTVTGDPAAQKAPGPVTFMVTAVRAGETTITVTSGAERATVQVAVE